MKRTGVLNGVRMLKFRDVFGRWEKGRLSELEAAELLGVTERTFRRWRRRYGEEGEGGLVDRRLGKPSPKRVPEAEAERIGQLYRERYQGFTAKHFHEHAVAKHGLNWSYTWTKTYLQNRGYLKRAPRRGAHRRKRLRKPLVGMMLHQDGSRHCWIPSFESALLRWAIRKNERHPSRPTLVAWIRIADAFQRDFAVLFHNLHCPRL